jgi:hypothetical protein
MPVFWLKVRVVEVCDMIMGAGLLLDIDLIRENGVLLENGLPGKRVHSLVTSGFGNNNKPLRCSQPKAIPISESIMSIFKWRV